MNRFRWLVVTILICTPSLLLAGAGVGQKPAERGAFVVLAGADTLATEHFTRTAAGLEGEMVNRRIGTVRYIAALDPDGSIPHIELSMSPLDAPPDAPPVQRASIILREDSVIAEITDGSGSEPQVQRIATREGAFPFLNSSFALTEQILRYARARGGEQLEIPLFLITGGQTVAATVTREEDDSWTITIAGMELHARVDGDGHLVAATIPAQGVTVERVDELDRAEPTA